MENNNILLKFIEFLDNNNIQYNNVVENTTQYENNTNNVVQYENNINNVVQHENNINNVVQYENNINNVVQYENNVENTTQHENNINNVVQYENNTQCENNIQLIDNEDEDGENNKKRKLDEEIENDDVDENNKKRKLDEIDEIEDDEDDDLIENEDDGDDDLIENEVNEIEYELKIKKNIDRIIDEHYDKKYLKTSSLLKISSREILDKLKSLANVNLNKCKKRNGYIDDFIFSSIMEKEMSKMITEMEKIKTESLDYLKNDYVKEIGMNNTTTFIKRRLTYWKKLKIVDDDVNLKFSGAKKHSKLKYKIIFKK